MLQSRHEEKTPKWIDPDLEQKCMKVHHLELNPSMVLGSIQNPVSGIQKLDFECFPKPYWDLAPNGPTLIHFCFRPGSVHFGVFSSWRAVS